MLNRELITTTTAGRGNVLQHHPISEAKIIPELVPRKIRAIKVVGYRAKTCPIPCYSMEEVPLLAPCLLLLSSQLSWLDVHFCVSFCKA